MIRIYTMDVSVYADGDLFEQDYRRMPASRRAKIDSLRGQGGKYRSLGAGVLLSRALAEAGFPADAETVTAENGKPCIPSLSDRFQFSLSHSGQRALCVVSAGEDAVPVGCDIEEIKTPDLRVADRFFHPDEIAYLRELSDPEEQAERFYLLWTLKESFVKAVGSGLSLPLNTFAVLPDSSGRITLRRDLSNGEFTFGCERTEDGYQLAWCAAF